MKPFWLYTDNDTSSVAQHETWTITLQTETVHTKPLTRGLIISSATKNTFYRHTQNKILYTFNNDRALDKDVESNWQDITILFLTEIQPAQKTLLCPDGNIHCKINTSLLKTHLKRTAAVRSSRRAVEMMIRVAGRASTDGTSTAHTVVDRASGIHNNLNRGTDQDVAKPVSTTN